MDFYSKEFATIGSEPNSYDQRSHDSLYLSLRLRLFATFAFATFGSLPSSEASSDLYIFALKRRWFATLGSE